MKFLKFSTNSLQTWFVNDSTQGKSMNTHDIWKGNSQTLFMPGIPNQNYSKTPSNTAPSNTDLEVTLFWLGLKIFELHWFFRVTLFLYEFKKETLKNSTYFFHELMSCLKSFIFSNFISNQFLQNWHEIFISTSLIKVTQSVKIVLNKCERSILCFLKLCFWSNRFLQNWHENRLFIYSFVERVLSKIDMNLFSVF